jgi:hypothetical protein
MRIKKIGYAVSILVTLLMLSGFRGHFGRVTALDVDLIPQQRWWWCWAASTEMISKFYGHRVTQCQSAAFIHGSGSLDCCTCSGEFLAGDCRCWGWDYGAYIDDMKDNWRRWNFAFNFSDSSLEWDVLKKTIHPVGSPIFVCLRWQGGGGHVVVISAYSETGPRKYLLYLDPWPPDCSPFSGSCMSVPGGEKAVSTYEAFVEDKERHWQESFYNFKYQPIDEPAPPSQ